MADYSDETLRALIRHLITEDVATQGIPPEALANRMAIAYLQAIKLLKVVLSPKGFVAAVMMGLVFEKEFTKSLIEFGIDEGRASVDAVTAFREADGRIFTKMAAFFATFGDKTAENKYKWLDYLASIKDDSIPASVVDGMFDEATKYGLLSEEDAAGATSRDRAIIGAVISGEPISTMFTKDDFQLSGNSFKPTKVEMTVADLEVARNLAKDENRHIDESIYEGLREAQELSNKGREAESKAAMNNVIRLYQSCVLLEEDQQRPTTKLTIFDSLEEIEGGITSNFKRNLDDIKKSVTGPIKQEWDNLITDTVDNVLTAIKDNPLNPFKNQSSSSGTP